MLLQREEKEAPKWELKEKKPSSARAVHHHPNTTTTGEQTSFACKNITRFIQIRAFRSRSTFAKKPNSRHHFCANNCLSHVCEKSSTDTAQISARRREKERNKRCVFANARSPLSLSIRARTRFVRSFRTSRSLERERDRERDTRRERRTMMNFNVFFFCARILWRRKRPQKRADDTRVHFGELYLSRDKVGDRRCFTNAVAGVLVV